MTETEKKIPNPIIAMLVLIAYFFGSMIGGFLMIAGFILERPLDLMVIWAILTFASMIAFQILVWKYRGLLLEWGLIESKEEKKQ